jgi:hypothetical protein
MIMIMSHDALDVRPLARWRRSVLACLAVLGWLLLAGMIASSYIGHSSSPYGVCYAASGRSVPCELAHH